jgi:hypothetical protein
MNLLGRLTKLRTNPEKSRLCIGFIFGCLDASVLPEKQLAITVHNLGKYLLKAAAVSCDPTQHSNPGKFHRLPGNHGIQFSH